MIDLRGFKIGIEMQGSRVEEYRLERSSEFQNEISCWVPGDVGAGADFSVVVRVPCPLDRQPMPFYIVFIQVDGQPTKVHFLPQSDAGGGKQSDTDWYIDDLKFTRFGPETPDTGSLSGNVVVTLARLNCQAEKNVSPTSRVGSIGAVHFRYRDRKVLLEDGILLPRALPRMKVDSAFLEHAIDLEKKKQNLQTRRRDLVTTWNSAQQKVSSRNPPKDADVKEWSAKGKKDNNTFVKPLRKRGWRLRQSHEYLRAFKTRKEAKSRKSSVSY
ncbi:hypothetical protein NMY22_g7902 [Coprinellus aureogranulatus]|nr:hypothetical protein NMY22_g7902 [Coprinellus aureogranulatus]